MFWTSGFLWFGTEAYLELSFDPSPSSTIERANSQERCEVGGKNGLVSSARIRFQKAF